MIVSSVYREGRVSNLNIGWNMFSSYFMSKMWTKNVVMIFLTLFSVDFFIISADEKCQTLDGTWYSDLGSKLSLNHKEEGIILGHYISSVEGELGSNSKSWAQSDVIGAAAYRDTEAVFGFSVMWNNGTSMKSWTGQCLVCRDDEVLETSWLLRQRVDGCADEWQSTNIGQTLFTRRMPGNDRVPQVRRRKRVAISIGKVFENIPAMGEAMNPARNVCSLSGYWYNELGSEMFLTLHQDTTVIGVYRTAVEREEGAAGKSPSKIYGVANADNPNSTIALYVVWKNGTSITGWVGQCHLCGENQTETLFTTWLLRVKEKSCDDNWKATLYGENTFTRHEQKEGPRRDPGQLDKVLNGSNDIHGKSNYKLHILLFVCLSVLSIILQ